MVKLMDYEQERHGGAGRATRADIRQAGLFNSHGVSFGHDETGRDELRTNGDGSIALFGGAGSSKSAAVFANNLIGGHMPGNFVCFDARGELASISLLSLTLQGYKLYFINPTGMHGLPSHRVQALDPVSYTHLTLPTKA